MTERLCYGRARVIACAIVAGILFAALAGLHAGQSSDSAVGGTISHVEFGFAPIAAAAGAAVGAIAGAMAGALWARRGLIGLVGAGLVVALGGLLGVAVAGLAGAESRVIVEGSAVGTEFGATRPVLYAGAAVGSTIGVLAAWRFRPRPAG